MKSITKPQLAKLHIMLTKLGLKDFKEEMIFNISNGRTTSSKELYFEEAKSLLMNLSADDPKERLKKVIFSLGYKAGIIYGNSKEDIKINTAKINMFIRERGAVKKELNQMTYDELVKTHRQFEAILINNKKSQESKQATEAVANLLGELNLNVSI